MEKVTKRFMFQDTQLMVGEVRDFSKTKHYQKLLSQRYISPVTGKFFSCKECGRAFVSEDILASHIQESHLGDEKGE